MRRSEVNHNHGTKSIAKSLYEAKQQAEQKHAIQLAQFRANQEALRREMNAQRMARVAQASR